MRVTYLKDGYFVVHFAHMRDRKREGDVLSSLGFTYDSWLRYWWTVDPLAAWTAAFHKER